VRVGLGLHRGETALFDLAADAPRGGTRAVLYQAPALILGYEGLAIEPPEGLVGDAVSTHQGDVVRGLAACAARRNRHHTERRHPGEEGPAIDTAAPPQLVRQHDAILVDALRFAARGTALRLA
jgi:hypothetical protein